MNRLIALALASLVCSSPRYTLAPDAKPIAQERRQADKDVPQLAEVLLLNLMRLS